MQSSLAEILLRKEDSTSRKIALKEKFVVVYEALFKGEDPSGGNKEFWSEVLLLKVNIPFLERCVILTAEDQLLVLKDNICNIFLNCSRAITDNSSIRAAHALETLTILLRSIFRKRFNNFGLDVVNILCGVDRADDAFKDLLLSLKAILDTSELYMKEAALNLLVVIITAVDNINQNTLFEYFMVVDFFGSFIKIISSVGSNNSNNNNNNNNNSSVTPTTTAFTVILVLITLANYQKYELQNIYNRQLAGLDDEKTLKAIGGVLTDVCFSMNRAALVGAQEPAGMLSRVGGFLSGFMRASQEVYVAVPTSPFDNSTNCGVCLLALYELVHENPFFVAAVLATESKVKRSPSTDVDLGSSSVILNASSISISPRGSPELSSPRVYTNGSSGLVSPRGSAGMSRQLSSSALLTSSSTSLLPAENVGAHSGLLQHFLTFASCLFAGDMKDGKVASYAKLCLLIIVGMAGNSFINNTLHITLTTSIEMIKDKKTVLNVLPPGVSSPGAEKQAMACAVLGVINLFMKQNLKKNRFSADMYGRSVGVVHRILSYEKNAGVRLSYKWKEMWNTLFNVIKYVTGEPTLLQGADVQSLCVQIVTVFNLFITFGDTFLPSPSDYDDLYYELMRVAKMWDHFYVLVEKTEVGGHNIQLNMLNLKTIISHFSSKIEQWTYLHPEVSITPDLVLKVIKENYDTLKLKLQENLDYYEPYIENPKEVPFFRQLTRNMISELKQTLTVSQIKLPSIL